jgi:rhamnogalacturonan endolyase
MKFVYAFAWITALMTCHAATQRQMEYFNRGLVAVNMGKGKVFLSWRMLGTEPDEVSYNLYRTIKGKTTRLNGSKPLQLTNFTDSAFTETTEKIYSVKPVINGKELPAGSGTVVLAKDASVQQYHSISLQVPPPANTGSSAYTYSANDASAADLDGDGEYEIILKWEPSNARNPPQAGITGTDIIDAYKLNGKLLWRINLGKNIRAGAAYTQFMVYDFDGDGKAEMICKTADGTIDGLGKPVGDSTKDWRTLTPSDSPFMAKLLTALSILRYLTGKRALLWQQLTIYPTVIH